MFKEVEGDVKLWHYRSKHIENGEERYEKKCPLHLTVEKSFQVLVREVLSELSPGIRIVMC